MGRVFLHVGAPKTGTTYLQSMLWANRGALARHGVLYPGTQSGAHFHGAQDLRRKYFLGHEDPRVPGAWDRLAAAAREWSGSSVVISHELLADSEPHEAERAAASVRPHEVHVLYTVRDLARQIPAAWQESVKNGWTVPYRDYLRALRSEPPEMMGRVFWRMQDAAQVLQRWQGAAPADRLHVVTVPPGGAEPGLLWRRFSQVIGVVPETLDVTPGSSKSRRNASLGLAETELLRRLTQRLEGELTWSEQTALLKEYLTQTVLSRRSTPRTGIPASERAWLLERSRAMVQSLRAAGYNVVGSLDELLPDFAANPDTDPDPDTGEVLEAAVDALAVLLTEQVAPGDRRVVARLRRWAAAARARLPVSW